MCRSIRCSCSPMITVRHRRPLAAPPSSAEPSPNRSALSPGMFLAAATGVSSGSRPGGEWKGPLSPMSRPRLSQPPSLPVVEEPALLPRPQAKHVSYAPLTDSVSLGLLGQMGDLGDKKSLPHDLFSSRGIQENSWGGCRAVNLGRAHLCGRLAL